jgi:ParB-like chromosome segregation protein Spo0J
VDTEGVIIAGHTRLLAAQKLGLSQVPVHIATDLSPQQIKAYRLADNRVAQEAEWDNDLLILELEELKEEGFDLDLTGFEQEEIEQLGPVNFEPGTEDDQGQLDQLEPKWIDCPHCGKEFDLREQS